MRYRDNGNAGLASRERSGVGHRAKDTVLRTEIVALIRDRYSDFGPTLIAEELADHHGHDVPRETVRHWMLADPNMTGSRVAHPDAACWSSSTVPRAESSNCALVQRNRRPQQRPPDLHDLNIDMIYAHSSQAKGRVERMNQTLQNRLVKKMRLEGIDTVPYDRVPFIFEPGPDTNELRRKRVTIFDYPDGTIATEYDGVSLPCSTFDKIGNIQNADVVDNKRLFCCTSDRFRSRMRSSPPGPS